MLFKNLLIVSFASGLISCNQEMQDSTFLSREEAQNKINNIIANIGEPQIPSDTIDIIEFSGHAPDSEGSFNFQPFINEAIDSLSNNGGGWLLLSADQNNKSWMRYSKTYRIEGPVFLKSNVGLLVDRSVKLFFPFDPEKYLVNGKGVLTRYEGTTIYSFSPLFRAFNAKNIVIKSRGTTGDMPEIDGDGEKWQRWMWDGEQKRMEMGIKASYQLLKDVNNADLPIKERIFTDPGKDYFRPEMMEFFLCKNVLVEGIKLTNSPFWCIKPVFSESCIFRNLRFDAMNVNNDGIDPESSKNVLIENIMFGNHDDNVAIKAGRDKEGRDGAIVEGTELENIASGYINKGRITGPTENVVIRNCHFYGHYAICIGSEMSGGVREVYAVDNYSISEVNMGFFIKSSRLRGGIVENIYINGLKLNHSKNQVIALIPNYDKADESPFPPTFRNVQIENVSCESSESGIMIHGWPDEPVENVFLRNIDLNNVENEELLIRQSLNIHLLNVKINGEEYDQVISRTDDDELPPGQI